MLTEWPTQQQHLSSNLSYDATKNQRMQKNKEGKNAKLVCWLSRPFRNSRLQCVQSNDPLNFLKFQTEIKHLSSYIKIMVWEQNRNYLQIITKSFSNRLIERFFWSMVPKSHLTSLSSSYTALVAKRALNWPTQMNKYDNSPKCVGDLSTRELSSCENGGNSEPF